MRCRWIAANVTEQELLAQLRDIHVPDPPGWWPPAVGWWLLGALVMALGLAAFIAVRRWRADAWRRVALREHRNLVAVAASDDAQVLSNLSVLMRRVAIKVEPRQQVASVTDEQWLSVLDRIGHTVEYTQGIGTLLAQYPYQNTKLASTAVPQQELAQLLKLTGQTIKRAQINSADRVSVAGFAGRRRTGADEQMTDGSGHNRSYREPDLARQSNTVQSNSVQGNTEQSYTRPGNTRPGNTRQDSAAGHNRV